MPRRKRLNHELRRPFFSFAGGSHQAAVVFGDKGLRRFHQEPFTSSTLQGISGRPKLHAPNGVRSTEGQAQALETMLRGEFTALSKSSRRRPRAAQRISQLCRSASARSKRSEASFRCSWAFDP